MDRPEVGDTAMIPAAIHEMILRYFGSGSSPVYGATPRILMRDPYRVVRARLQRIWDVFDFTDLNYDLGCNFILRDHSPGASVRLSAVGPFAVVIGSDGNLLT